LSYGAVLLINIIWFFFLVDEEMASFIILLYPIFSWSRPIFIRNLSWIVFTWYKVQSRFIDKKSTGLTVTVNERYYFIVVKDLKYKVTAGKNGLQYFIIILVKNYAFMFTLPNHTICDILFYTYMDYYTCFCTLCLYYKEYWQKYNAFKYYMDADPLRLVDKA